MDRTTEDLDDIEELEKEEEFLTPFSDETIDTTQIDIATELRSLDSMIQMMRFKEIDMNTEFQRHADLWPPATSVSTDRIYPCRAALTCLLL